jgi:predicted bacteriocin transport accessory protein
MKEEQIKKLMTCLYIIIALLVINTIILFTNNVSVGTSNTSSSEETEESSDYDVSMFNSVTTDEAIKLFDSSDTQVIYIGRSTCGYCVKFLPTLQQAQEDFGYTTNYLDITTVDSDGQTKLLAKDNDENFLEENFGSTPMVILVKDGKMVDTWVGYSEYDSFAEFLTNNGFSK